MGQRDNGRREASSTDRRRVLSRYVDVVVLPNWHGPHPPCAAESAVPRASHDWSPLSVQKDAVPESWVLFVSVSASRLAGNLEGSGLESALLSRCSSRRAVNPERSSGRVPLREVEERSLGKRSARRVFMTVDGHSQSLKRARC